MITAKKVGKAILFLLLTILLCPVLRFFLMDDVHTYASAMMREFYQNNGKIQTLFLGASHCLRSIDPLIVDEQLDTYSFNAGSSNQMPDISYYLLREAAERNNLQTVYLETFIPTFQEESPQNMAGEYYIVLDFMDPHSENLYNLAWEAGGGISFFPQMFFPMREFLVEPLQVFDLWKLKITDGYAPGNYKYASDGNDEYRGRGFLYNESWNHGDFLPTWKENLEHPITDFALENLNRIADYCSENNIRLVLFTAPFPNKHAQNLKTYQAYVDAMQAFAREKGTEYWDFTLFRDQEMLPLTAKHFMDDNHLNGAGAELFTRAFCETAKRSASGEDVSSLFYDTLAEKLAYAPDGTVNGEQ